jgi:hypothetical protein
MPDHPNQPHEYDAVLGGQTPIPTTVQFWEELKVLRGAWLVQLKSKELLHYRKP